MKTERLKLASSSKHLKQIDMEWVYEKLDSGRTVKSVAQELNVSESTLRRRHKEYQAKIKEKNQKDLHENWV